MIPNRLERMASVVRQALSEVLLRQESDPRLQGVQVTEVRMAPDGRSAKVYWVSHDGEAARESVAQALEDAAGRLRRELAGHAVLRHVPTLRFYIDDRYDTAERVSRILEKLGNPSGGERRRDP